MSSSLVENMDYKKAYCLARTIGRDIEKEAFTLKDDTGIMVNSEFLNGMTVKEAIPAMKKWLVENGIGTEKVNYKLRDWVFSRQRYWGSLVPLVEKGHDCAKMQGLALKNIAVKLVNAKGRTVYEDFGELLFTHFGLSGPVILSASAHMARGEDSYTVKIDLKPALDEKTLDARILRDFSAAQNRDFENSLSALLPKSMIRRHCLNYQLIKSELIC